jgi:hypothetical protein
MNLMIFINEPEYFTGMFFDDTAQKNATRLWEKPRKRLMKE